MPPCYILDNGTGLVKGGHSDQKAAEKVVPNVLARLENDPKVYFGESAYTLAESRDYKLSFPMNEGTVDNWDDMTSVWRHVMSKESSSSAGHSQPESILATSDLFAPKVQAETIINRLFEVFSAQAAYVCSGATLSLFAAGRTWGIVCDMGEGSTRVVPVLDGQLKIHHGRRSKVSGRVISKYFENEIRSILAGSAPCAATTGDSKVSRSHKLGHKFLQATRESKCYVSVNYNDDIECEGLGSPVTLPDGTSITLGKVKLDCAESYFKPSIVGLDDRSLADLIFVCGMSIEPEFRNELWSNIVLCGGSSGYQNLSQRMNYEINSLLPSSAKPKTTCVNDPIQSAFIGGGILVSLGSFQEVWVTQSEYNDCGPNIIHRKCFE